MNKTKSAYRKCAFCPHHNQESKCCCKVQTKSSQKLNKTKSKNKNCINESSIRYIDDSHLKLQEINISNLMAQNSMLKCENNNLKNDLLSLSHCIKEERTSINRPYSSVNTCSTLRTESQQILSDRLYVSNKNLQQAILQVDNLSRRNKQLSDENSILNSQVDALGLQKEQLKDDITTLRKQLKRLQQNTTFESQRNALKQNLKSLRLKYQNLKIVNSNLNSEIERLNIELCKKNDVRRQSMSPGWIAETSNKLSFIEQKISDCAGFSRNEEIDNKLQKQHVGYVNCVQQQPQGYLVIDNHSQGSYFQVLHQMKKQIALAVNTIHSRTRKFNSVFDTIGNVQNISATDLICTLIQGFVESCINLNISVQRQLNRKINVLQKRMENLLGKLENFVLEFKNRELRKRSTSCSRILVKNKSGLTSRSPYTYISNKENISMLNNIDKSQY